MFTLFEDKNSYWYYFNWWMFIDESLLSFPKIFILQKAKMNYLLLRYIVIGKNNLLIIFFGCSVVWFSKTKVYLKKRI